MWRKSTIKTFCLRLSGENRERMAYFVPGYFHSMSELVRTAIRDALREGLVGPEITIIKDRERKAITLQIPPELYQMILDAVHRTNGIKYTGSFIRLAIIKYLKILDLITNGKNG